MLTKQGEKVFIYLFIFVLLFDDSVESPDYSCIVCLLNTCHKEKKSYFMSIDYLWMFLSLYFEKDYS